jgi:hypothetical protein
MAQPALSTLPYLEWTEPASGELVRLYADVVKDEAPVLPAVVTDHPIEHGTKIVDHYRQDPKTFRMSMFFSGSPLRSDLDPDVTSRPKTYNLIKGQYPDGPPIYTPGGLTNAIGSGISAGLSALGLGGSGTPTQWTGIAFDVDPKSRFEKIVQLIDRLQAGGILVTCRYSFGTLDNLAILNAAPHRSAETGDGLELELDMKQVRFVTSDITFGAPLPVELRAIPKKSAANVGNGSEITGPKKTALKALGDSTGTNHALGL